QSKDVDRVRIVPNVASKLLLNRRRVRLESLSERAITGDALIDQLHVFNHLGLARILVAEHQVMTESPRLSIEDAALLALVVNGRVVLDAHQSREWYEFILAQQHDVMRYRSA